MLNLPGLKGSEATLRAKAGGISVVRVVSFLSRRKIWKPSGFRLALRSCDISAVLFLLRRLWKEELLP